MSELAPLESVRLWNLDRLVESGTVRSHRQSDATSDDELVDEWLSGKSANTRKAYLRDVNLWRGFLWQREKLLVTATVTDVKAYQGELEQMPRYNRNGDAVGTVSHNTVVRRLNVVKSFYKYAVEIAKVLRDNPATAIGAISPHDRTAERILTRDEVLTVIALEPNPRNRVMLRFLYDSGVRISELSRLTWNDFRVRDDGSVVVNILGKGNKRRAVPLPPQTWELLQSVRRDDGDRLFCTAGGIPLSQSQIRRIVRNAAERAGIDRAVSPHWLRHCHATHALRRNADIGMVQSTLGHSNVATTSKYLHADPQKSSAYALYD